MSMPTIPDISSEIDRDDAINLLITSIAMEELSLAHILNAEGEKIQYVLGTLEGKDPGEVTICDVMQINDNVNKTIKNVLLTEILLQFKLENAIDLEKPKEETETTTITVKKEWRGIAYDARPDYIEIYLYRNGVKYKTAQLDTKINVVEFENVPVYDSKGNTYVYTVDEEDVPGYTKDIDGFTISNTVAG